MEYIMTSSILVLRAQTLITLAGEGPVRGRDLFAPLKKIDNAALVVRNSIVEDALPWPKYSPPADACVCDLGSVCLAPACVNAHTHLNLSHLTDRTVWGKGFAAWLESLIPQLDESHVSPQTLNLALQDACADMAGAGTAHVGNFCGMNAVNPGPASADDACRICGLGVTHFCEWLGFDLPFNDGLYPWPTHCRTALADRELQTRSAPCGHALYSTSPQTLDSARRFCAREGKIFAFHLAESSEEDQMLTSGNGPLKDLYAECLLPKNWRAPGIRPFDYAESLNLLGPGVLAIHGVWLNAREAGRLAASGAALCLCPRSNSNLGVGAPPVHMFMENNVLLCLGTDGLASNSDLDVRGEAKFLREMLDVPPEALIRLLTVNGAAALGLENAGRLTPGSAAEFCILPASLVY
ncbi:MAG: amidohydrolase family protein [Desulfovibrio sp.]|jgi:cytosine/adenosine deaminase-related metal-dependent hydrolase|nr:amidohydrolase family protein [Desulfovibrio sp.]